MHICSNLFLFFRFFFQELGRIGISGAIEVISALLLEKGGVPGSVCSFGVSIICQLAWTVDSDSLFRRVIYDLRVHVCLCMCVCVLCIFVR